MKSYDDKIRMALIRECIALFEQMRRSGKKSVYCGSPPELLLLRIGHYPPGEEHRGGKFPRKGAEAYLYQDRRLSATTMSRKRSTIQRGVYYDEAYAEAVYDESGKATITMNYGPRYASSYTYDVSDEGPECLLKNERLEWIS